MAVVAQSRREVVKETYCDSLANRARQSRLSPDICFESFADLPKPSILGLQLTVYITPKLAWFSKTETVEAPLK